MIKAQFLKGMHGKMGTNAYQLTKYRVVKVSRIENLNLWQSYVAKKLSLEQRAEKEGKDSSKYEHKYYWHGTWKPVYENLYQQGFNRVRTCGQTHALPINHFAPVCRYIAILERSHQARPCLSVLCRKKCMLLRLGHLLRSRYRLLDWLRPGARWGDLFDVGVPRAGGRVHQRAQV